MLSSSYFPTTIAGFALGKLCTVLTYRHKGGFSTNGTKLSNVGSQLPLVHTRGQSGRTSLSPNHQRSVVRGLLRCFLPVI